MIFIKWVVSQAPGMLIGILLAWLIGRWRSRSSTKQLALATVQDAHTEEPHRELFRATDEALSRKLERDLSTKKPVRLRKDGKPWGKTGPGKKRK